MSDDGDADPGAEVDADTEADPGADPAVPDGDRRGDERPGSGGGATPESTTDGGGGPATRAGRAGPVDGIPEADLTTYAEWAAFLGLCLIALVSVWQFYAAVPAAIGVWFTDAYVPVFQAAFNRLVAVAAAAGISTMLRRLR